MYKKIDSLFDDSESDSYSDLDNHFGLFCKNIDPSLKKLLGITDEDEDSKEICDWKPPEKHGLQNSVPIVPSKKIHKLEHKLDSSSDSKLDSSSDYKSNSSSDNILDYKSETTIDYKSDSNSEYKSDSETDIDKQVKRCFKDFYNKLNPSLRKLVGLAIEETQGFCDWKAPEKYGLQNSEPIIPSHYFYNKSSFDSMNINIFKELENDIRKLRVLTSAQLKFIQTLTKDEIFYLIKIYNDCYFNLII